MGDISRDLSDEKAHRRDQFALGATRPEGRDLPNAWCEIEVVNDKPQILEGGRRIVWNATDLRDLGIEYRLQWFWPS